MSTTVVQMCIHGVDSCDLKQNNTFFKKRIKHVANKTKFHRILLSLHFTTDIVYEDVQLYLCKRTED